MFHEKPTASKENGGTGAAAGPMNALQWYLGEAGQYPCALQPWVQGVIPNTNDVLQKQWASRVYVPIPIRHKWLHITAQMEQILCSF